MRACVAVALFCAVLAVFGQASADPIAFDTVAEMLEDPIPLPPDPEVHIISGYQAEVTDGQAVIVVHINRPGRDVVLVLSTYHSVLWQVKPGPGTRIAGILVDPGRYRSWVYVPADAPVRRSELDRGYTLDSHGFARQLNSVGQIFSVDRVTSAFLQYDLPPSIVIGKTLPSEPRLALDWPNPEPLTSPDDDVTFTFYNDYAVLQTWTLRGPVSGDGSNINSPGRLAISPDGNRIFAFDAPDMWIIDRKTGEERQVPMPLGMVHVSHFRDIAYDSLRDHVAIVTSGGEGFLYRFDAQTEQWLDARSMDHDDIGWLAYDASADAFIGFIARGRRLIAISPETMHRLDNVVAAEPLFHGFHRVLPGRSEFPNLAVVAVEDGHVLLGYGRGHVGGIWWLPRGETAARLTYRAGTDD